MRWTKIVVDVLYGSQDPERLEEIAKTALALLQEAVVESFSDSIMRLDLCSAPLLFTVRVIRMSAMPERGRTWLRAKPTQSAMAMASSIGLLNNLAAVIDLNDIHLEDEDARQRFRICPERLRHRGLTFWGAEDRTYPNAFAIVI